MRQVVACVCGLWSWVGLAGLRGASDRVAGLGGLFCDLGIRFSYLSFQFFI